MTAIRLLLPRGNLRRWHRALAERLTAGGYRVFIELHAAATPPPAIALIETLEGLLYARGNVAPSDPLPEGQWRPDESSGPSDLVFDLTGSPNVEPGAIVPLYDGAPGDAARDAALLGARAPSLDLARRREDGWEVLAHALPAIERPEVLRSGRDGVANRTMTLIAQLAQRGPVATGAAASPARPDRPEPLRFLSAGLIELARRRLLRLVANERHWRIGLRAIASGQSAYAAFDGPGGDCWQWLPDDRQRYFADPFVFEDNGATYVFCEEYPYATQKGVISMFTLGAQGKAGEPRIALERPYHLSYPNVFRHDGQIWMMPESSRGRTLEIYRADPFPYRWTLDRVVLRDIAISDATAFEWKSDWFLTGATNEPGTLSWDCLSLYSGPGPLGPWTPCGDGPALIDASASRPAGNFFRLGDDLVRPVQDCTGSYGSGLAFCRVDEVGRGVFKQTALRRFAPPASVHTFNFTNRYLAIDHAGSRGRTALFDRPDQA